MSGDDSGESFKAEDKGREEKPLPPVNFATLILSLASSAQVHLGLIPDPATNKAKVSLPPAKQTIDILEMLQEKTKGNLEEYEAKLLEQILFELRMQYVECSKNVKI